MARPADIDLFSLVFELFVVRRGHRIVVGARTRIVLIFSFFVVTTLHFGKELLTPQAHVFGELR